MSVQKAVQIADILAVEDSMKVRELALDLTAGCVAAATRA
jgi:hypothetical protein